MYMARGDARGQTTESPSGGLGYVQSPSFQSSLVMIVRALLQRPLVPQLDAVPNARRQRGQHEGSENRLPVFYRQQDTAQDKDEP